LAESAYFCIVSILRKCKKGAKKSDINIENLGELPKSMSSKLTSDKLRKFWNQYNGKANRIIKAVSRCFVSTIIMITAFELLCVAGTFTSTYLLQQIIDFIGASKHESVSLRMYKGSILLIAMIFVRIATSFLQTTMGFREGIIGGQSIIALDTLIYEKAMKLSSKSCKTFTPAKFMNLVQLDCIKVATIMNTIAEGINLVATFVMAISMLYKFLGMVALVGMAICLISIIVNYIIARVAKNYQDRTMKLKDERIRKTTEAFQYIRILKMYGWTELFHQIINDARGKEVNATQTRRCISGLLTCLLFLVPKFVSIVAFFIYATLYEHITIGAVFASLSVFNTLNRPLRLLPWWINVIIDSYISNKRLNEFLECEEVPEIYNELSKNNESTHAIEINGCNFTWTEFKNPNPGDLFEGIKDAAININSSVVEKQESETPEKKESEQPLLQEQKNIYVSHEKITNEGYASSKTKPLSLTPMKYTPSAIPFSHPIGYDDLMSPANNKKSIEQQNLEATSFKIVEDVSEPIKISEETKNSIKPKINKQNLDTIAEQPIPVNEKSQSVTQLELQKINLKVKRGELVYIIGEIGSGKSSLLQALIGELKMVPSRDISQFKRASKHITDKLELFGEGQNQISEKLKLELQSSLVNKAGKFAYVEQNPWMQNASIKDNITFISKFDDKKYNETIKLCELEEDFNMLPAGDLTEIGERGINLSGGQKARISLARAVYSDRDIYLLDDPLSALDTKVKGKIFNKCIMKKLADKTRIIVSHCMDFLDKADRIIVLDNGQIVFDGNYKEYINLDKFVSTVNKITLNGQKPNNSESSLLAAESKNIVSNEKLQNEAGKIISVEEYAKEGVSFSVYKRYLSALGGVKFMTLFNIIMISYFACTVGGDYLFGSWAKTNLHNSEGYLYLILNTILALGGMILTAFKVLTIFVFARRASRKLHENMLTKILNAPVNLFFDVTPLGRLINRLSNDLESVDIDMPVLIGNIAAGFWSFISCIILTILTIYWSLLSMPLFIFSYLYYLKSYLQLQRKLFRLERISRSPIMLYGEELYRGACTIRAYEAQEKCISKAHKLFENYLKCHIHSAGLDGWANLRIQIVSLIMNVLTIVFIVFF